jgi:hypothetical protein
MKSIRLSAPVMGFAVLFAAVSVLLPQCKSKQDKDEQVIDDRLADVSVMYREIPNQYVVILKNEKPVIADGKQKKPDRKEQSKLNEAKRQGKLNTIDEIIRGHQLEVPSNHRLTDVLVGFKAYLTPAQHNRLRNESSIDIYPDFEVRLRNPIQQGDPVVSRNPIQQDYAEMWDFVDTERRLTCAVANAGGPMVAADQTAAVWVLDTGVDFNHDDLNVVDDADLAVSFVPGETTDGNGHGTHVAGIIGAKENDLGATGVSPGAQIIPVKVLRNSGSGSWSYLLLGLDHVARFNKAGDVVNLSLGTLEPSQCVSSKPAYRVLEEAIKRLAEETTYVVIASGNESGKARHSLPACIDREEADNIFVVAAVNCDEVCETYSNFDRPPVLWVASGTNVFSTYPGNLYAVMSGTSMATAVVSGIIHAKGGPPSGTRTVGCGSPPTEYKVARAADD